MGSLFYNLPAHPFAKLDYSLLMAGRAKVAALIGKDQKMFVTTLLTSDSGKAVTQNPTVQIAVDHGPQIGTIKTIGPLKTFLIDPFKGFKMILDTMVICLMLLVFLQMQTEIIMTLRIL